jgi:hypothetical protein
MKTPLGKFIRAFARPNDLLGSGVSRASGGGGATRNEDRFYVVPTRVALQALAEHRRASLARSVKDEGHWVLKWHELRSGQSQPNYGFEKKWAEYLNRWDGLETMAIE